jgi:hypothetical protein
LYIFLLDEAAYNNHTYLIVLISFLMVFIPAGRLARSSPAQRGQRSQVPFWCVALLRFQVGVPYLFGGLAKLNTDWLVHAQPMRLWLTTGGVEAAFDTPFFKQPALAYFFSWSGLLLDLLIVPFLLWKRTRIPAFAVIVGFHLMNSRLFNIGIFPWLMIGLTTIFFPPDWPYRIGLARKVTRGKASTSQPEAKRLSAPVSVALGLWILVQVSLPFRHFLIPGQVNWTEEGSRFSWRMKLRDKRGEMQFLMVDPAARTATVLKDADVVLTLNQRLMMTQDPEMMRQFAVFNAQQLRDQGYSDFEIHVVTQLSLNGREPQPLVDPEVDLASTTRSLFAAPWVLPLDPTLEPRR